MNLRLGCCRAGDNSQNGTIKIAETGHNAEETAPSHGSANKSNRYSVGDAQASVSQQKSNQREFGHCVQLLEANKLGGSGDESPLAPSTPKSDFSDGEKQQDALLVSGVDVEEKAACMAELNNSEELKESRRFSDCSPHKPSQPCSVASTLPVSPCIEPLISSLASLDHPQASANRRTVRSFAGRGAEGAATLIEFDNDQEDFSPSSSSRSSSSSGSEYQSSCNFDSDASVGMIEDFTTGVDAWLEDIQSVGRQEFFGLFKRDVTPQFSRPAHSVLGRNVSV